MRHVREVVRMHREARVPMRKIARLTGLTRPTVRDMVVRFERSGLELPGPSKIGDINLEGGLYGALGAKPGRRKLPEPDWPVVTRELKCKHVNLQVLWEEYRAEHPDGYRYSRFCDLFRRWPPAAGHAPKPCRRREAVPRLRWRYGADRGGSTDR